MDQDGSGQIGYVEFEKAWNQIQREIVRTRMQEAGITKGRVACLFLYSVFLLLLVFAFIFVGVTAFVGEGAFGAVINSSLTAGKSHWFWFCGQFFALLCSTDACSPFSFLMHLPCFPSADVTK